MGLSGGHSTKIDCVAWSPVHKDVLASASCDDKRISIWDARCELDGAFSCIASIRVSCDLRFVMYSG